jgi:hypothetical protein
MKTNAFLIKNSFFLIITLAILFPCKAIAQQKVVKLEDGVEIIIYPDKTWEYYDKIPSNFDIDKIGDNDIPDFLRQGIEVSKDTILTAIELHKQGWTYFMPSPKCQGTARGNQEGKTTWWCGYWYNKERDCYSYTIPVKKENGLYYGDRQNKKDTWRWCKDNNKPSKLQWLLSKKGGIKPE